MQFALSVPAFANDLACDHVLDVRRKMIISEIQKTDSQNVERLGRLRELERLYSDDEFLIKERKKLKLIYDDLTELTKEKAEVEMRALGDGFVRKLKELQGFYISKRTEVGGWQGLFDYYMVESFKDASTVFEGAILQAHKVKKEDLKRNLSIETFGSLGLVAANLLTTAYFLNSTTDYSTIFWIAATSSAYLALFKFLKKNFKIKNERIKFANMILVETTMNHFWDAIRYHGYDVPTARAWTQETKLQFNWILSEFQKKIEQPLCEALLSKDVFNHGYM